MLLCQHDYFLPDNWQSDSCVQGLSILEDKGAIIYRLLYTMNTSIKHVKQFLDILAQIQLYITFKLFFSRSLGTLVLKLDTTSLNQGKHVHPSLKKDIHLIVGQLI